MESIICRKSENQKLNLYVISVSVILWVFCFSLKFQNTCIYIHFLICLKVLIFLFLGSLYVYLVSVNCKKHKFPFKNYNVIFLYFTFIANASNSIIGMWALKPSILELLAVKLLPYDKDLAQHSPVLQYSVLYLLYSHCSR